MARTFTISYDSLPPSLSSLASKEKLDHDRGDVQGNQGNWVGWNREGGRDRQAGKRVRLKRLHVRCGGFYG